LVYVGSEISENIARNGLALISIGFLAPPKKEKRQASKKSVQSLPSKSLHDQKAYLANNRLNSLIEENAY
jgi:hypothetical protein